MRRATMWLVLALGMALLAPMTARAQEPGVVLAARALYEGTSKYGEWLPVVVNVENSGADTSGLVQVSVTGSASGTATFAQRLELPRGARKQVTLYTIPNNFARRLVVEWLPEGADEATVTQEVAVRPVPNIRYMVGTITAGGDGLEALAGVNFRGERRTDEALLVPLTLDTLPDRPEALRTLDLLVLSGVDTTPLTPRQRAALEQYVAFGGVLALGGGPEAARVLAGLPATLQPVALAGEVALPALPSLEQATGETVRVPGPFAAAQGQPVAGAEVRFREGDLPLVVERPVGDGAVFWLALDPALTPFDAWAGTQEFWQALVGRRAAYPVDLPPDISPRQSTNEQLFYALQNLPSLDLPSLRLLVPLLAAYIFAVGPLNYLVLRRQRRLELAWATIPAITLLFSVGAYGLGFRLRGSDVILNQVALVQTVPGGEGGYVRSMVGIFSPSRRAYDLSVSGEPLVSPARVPGDPFNSTGSSSTQARIVQGEPATIEGFVVNQWTMQSVMVETLATEGYGLDAALQASDGAVVGTVTNRSGQRWEDVVVALGTQFERIGDMAPGESKQVSLKMGDMGNQPGADIAWRIFEQEFNNPRGASRDVQVRQQMLSSLFNAPFGVESGTLAGSRLPVLLAWLPTPPTAVSLAGDSRSSTVGTTLLYSEIPIGYGSGAVSLPRGLIAARIAQNDGSFCYGPSLASLSPDFSEAEIHFELPAALRGINPSLLTLYVTSDGGWFAAPQLALYDHAAQGWSELTNPVLGRNRVEEPDAFLDPNGVIRLRVQNPERNRGGCLFFDVALDGELPAPVGGVER